MTKKVTTIADVAERAGVSIGAVSYALNGRKGVSEATRERVLRVADEMGWAPGSSARSLAGAKTDIVGLVIARGPNALGVDSFFVRFITGIESELAKRKYSLLLQVVPDVQAEVESHKLWAASRRVDGVILVDPRQDDPRIAALSASGALPAVVSGDISMSGGLTSVWTDDDTAMRETVRYLAALQHTRIARVSGIANLAHTLVRDEAFTSECLKLGVEGTIVRADFTAGKGASATRSLLSIRFGPTAIIYDNDLMAMSGMSVAAEMGLSVPRDVSIVAWDDSNLCELTYPPLSAVNHDVVHHGATVARTLFEVIDGAKPAQHLDSVPKLVVRGTIAAPLPDRHLQTL